LFCRLHNSATSGQRNATKEERYANFAKSASLSQPGGSFSSNNGDFSSNGVASWPEETVVMGELRRQKNRGNAETAAPSLLHRSDSDQQRSSR
jgi:hypothetical protein